MRSGQHSGIDLQERDFQILVGLFECRVMSLRHICELHFEGRMEAAKKRVQKLKSSGLVRERARRIGDPSILHLTRKAFVELKNSCRLDRFPPLSVKVMEKRAQVSDLTIRHELEVMDVRTALFTALRGRKDLTISEFSTWPALYQFTAQHASPILGRREILIKPDGFLRIREKEGSEFFEHLFFLEVDRSTETQEILAQKAACYLDFYQRGGMAERFGERREEFRKFPFRVLMVFRSKERLNNTAVRLLRNTPSIQTQVWLTTFAEILSNPYGQTWLRPKDVLEILAETPFDPKRDVSKGVYKRNPARGDIVNRVPIRLSLFD